MLLNKVREKLVQNIIEKNVKIVCLLVGH